MNTTPFVYANQNALATLVTCISLVFITSFVLVRGWHNKVCRIFGAYTIAISAWSICWFEMEQAHTMANSLFWGRFVTIPSPFIPATFLHFAQFLLNRHGRKESILRWLFYIVALGFSSISFSNLIFSSSTWRPNLNCYYTEPGPMYIFYTLFFFGTVLFTLWSMWDGYKNAQGVKKTQIGYVLGAYTFGYLGGSTTFLPIYHLPMPTYSLYTIPIAHVAITYLIFKHRLLDINIALRRAGLITFIYAGLAAVLIPTAWMMHPIFAEMRGGSLFEIFLMSAVLSIGPFLYAYLIRKSTFFQERIVSGVTHEFKSPLASIQSAAEILQQEMQNIAGGKSFDSAQGKIADYLLMIQNNSERLERFIQNLLQVSKIEQGQPELKLEEADLNDICQKAIQLYKPIAEQKDIRLEFVPNGSELVRCDTEKIQMVISNLLSNAVKFTTHGKIRLKIEPRNKETCVSVEDTGVGISTEDLPYIFDKFYQGKNGNGAKGTGLGLSIVKGWVEAHGGRVWVESGGTNRGTCICFTLPQ